MKAKYAGYCTSCAIRIEPGTDIEIFLGGWTHTACKKAEIARRAEARGGPVELELVMPKSRPTEYVGVRSQNRRSLRQLHARQGR
ncbi:hypothetical protein [Streptomyces paludis]|uniref:hypothetical protein n=1 Tax=Streptomyces paludis TaxID=2282738 RepID=UPI0013B45C3D|nr:hypothetical protein [Streptomyces paludis]